ncbi:regulator of G-protein signaling 7-like isoform X2 [Convolutriloba macropyga]|uniref:regulator of G-protein signaling 7-like isoform X2 n=1 Tax=Convolutriloba macropyga TaxID=536237 RepID=UPI003F51DFE2
MPLPTVAEDKNGASKKDSSNVDGGGLTGSILDVAPPLQENLHPNHVLFKKMESLVERMQDEKEGVPIKNAKSFMSKQPSVFTGADLTQWLIKSYDIDESEAVNLASLTAAHGYFFPIDAHNLTVTNDGAFYRFQTPYFWPSNCWEPENTDYAVYLCKRTMLNKTRLELADYEAESLSKLQKMFSRNWEFIFMQAEAQAKVDRKRDKMERKILDSQERAFWDVHRPMPGSVNTTEIDIRKSCKLHKPLKTRKANYNVPGGRLSPSLASKKNSVSNGPGTTATGDDTNNNSASGTDNNAAGTPTPSDKSQSGGGGAEKKLSTSSIPPMGLLNAQSTLEELHQMRDTLKLRLNKSHVKMSKVADFLIQSCEQYREYDPMLTPAEPSNPWISEETTFWDLEKNTKDYSTRRVKRWAFSIDEVLRDPAGKEQFAKFLAKEYSIENLNFYNNVYELKKVSEKEVVEKVKAIWAEFLDPNSALSPVNIDSKCMDKTRKEVFATPGRHTFDDARDHIYKLMRSDSYPRFIKSEQYKELIAAKRKEYERAASADKSGGLKRKPMKPQFSVVSTSSKN